jgi:hypothetical protein
MAGYASQTDYEADLLQTYMRKGRVSPIAKRDVDLALSIYKMPKAKTNYKDLKGLDYASAKKSAKGKSDAQVMQMAKVAVLNKAIQDRKTAATAAAAAKAASTMSAPAPTRPAAPVPPRPPAPASTTTTPVTSRLSAPTNPLSAAAAAARRATYTIDPRTRYTPPATTKPRTPRTSTYTVR